MMMCTCVHGFRFDVHASFTDLSLVGLRFWSGFAASDRITDLSTWKFNSENTHTARFNSTSNL